MSAVALPRGVVAPRAISKAVGSFARVGSSLGGQVTVVKRVVPRMAFPLGKNATPCLMTLGYHLGCVFTLAITTTVLPCSLHRLRSLRLRSAPAEVGPDPATGLRAAPVSPRDPTIRV